MKQAVFVHFPIKHSALVWLVIGLSSVSAQVSGQEFISVRHPESLPLLGREPYFSVLRDGALFITTHLRKDEIRNPDRYTHSYVHGIGFQPVVFIEESQAGSLCHEPMTLAREKPT